MGDAGSNVEERTQRIAVENVSSKVNNAVSFTQLQTEQWQSLLLQLLEYDSPAECCIEAWPWRHVCMATNRHSSRVLDAYYTCLCKLHTHVDRALVVCRSRLREATRTRRSPRLPRRQRG